ncbi:uncharacterized protein LOC125947095 [Dermacentor silvarum]|uniref:uncharacterized protein LOC125947095 n=1 Tax=Dermacentor silvarum TaxID=543639 RepID=UPI00210136E2|nr:uncharacterized protein LOC125947095 [Dermacentor silvarum]
MVMKQPTLTPLLEARVLLLRRRQQSHTRLDIQRHHRQVPEKLGLKLLRESLLSLVELPAHLSIRLQAQSMKLRRFRPQLRRLVQLPEYLSLRLQGIQLRRGQQHMWANFV